MNTSICSFTGEYAFLSNFWQNHPFHSLPYGDWYEKYPVIEWKSNEHYYQAAKSDDFYDWIKISKLKTASEAKKIGRKLNLRSDWEETKYDVMLTGLRNKFTNPELTKLLLNTDRIPLIEGNTWGDKTWGAVLQNDPQSIYSNNKIWVGENWLGKLLELVREERRAWRNRTQLF